MQIHFFNSYLQGGAAYGAINLFEHINNVDIEKHFFYMRDLSNGKKLERLTQDLYTQRQLIDQNSVISRLPNSLKARKYHRDIQSHLESRNSDFEQFSPAWQYISTPYQWFSKQQPDIIHLHWIAEWIDYPSFFKSIPNNIPIVWTLHDMNPFTGGCHYSWDCKKYKAACQTCPQLGLQGRGDLAQKNWQIKLEALKNRPLHIVGDSNWITEEAKQSPLFSGAKSFQTIHYSIDFNVFKPIENNESIKAKYQIPSDAFILCFGAADFTNKRKGFEALSKALEIINQKNSNIHCLVFGAGEIEQSALKLPPIHYTGALSAQELAEVYSTADLFVIPSLYEAFGLTAIESMACGTPVIGFATGGIPDSVIDGQSGWLVKTGDSEQLAEKIIYLSHHPSEIKTIGESAKAFARESFHYNVETQKYIDLYQKILKSN